MYRNPLIILVKKECLSVARLRAKVFSLPYPISVLHTVLSYAGMRIMVRISGAPVIEVNYSDIVRDPQTWLTEFVECLGLRSADTTAALSFVKRGKKDYQDWKNRKIMPYHGFVEFLDAHYVRGWARHKMDNRPVTVDIHVQGRFVTSVKAEKYRQDVAEKIEGSDGYCGFKAYFDPPLSDRELQSVEVSVDTMVLVHLS